MKRNMPLLLVVLGGIIGWLLAERRQKPIAPASSQSQPKRKNRTLEEIAPVLKTDGDHLYDADKSDDYIDYWHAAIDQLVRDDLTDVEVHLAREKIKSMMAGAMSYRENVAAQTEMRRDRLTNTWINSLEEDNDDEGN